MGKDAAILCTDLKINTAKYYLGLIKNFTTFHLPLLVYTQDLRFRPQSFTHTHSHSDLILVYSLKQKTNDNDSPANIFSSNLRWVAGSQTAS